MVTEPEEAAVPKPRIAVAGAGLIGRKHIEIVANHATLAGIIDPAPHAEKMAGDHGVPWTDDLARFLMDHRPDGVIVATPNQRHVPHGIACIEACIPALIEKPIADRSDDARRLVAAAEAANVPLLIGHHRRHNPLINAAKEAIQAGRLGDIISVNAQFWLYKPDDYFDVAWRTCEGAGPVFINLIHDIDLIRHLVGDIVTVQAMESRKARGHDVEDTAAILLEFANGALGTVAVSDAIVAPWSWEFTSAENTAYPHINGACYTIGGSHASLSIPDMALWHHPGKRGWWEPMEKTTLPAQVLDPLIAQIRHFAAVINGTEQPVVSGREGLRTLRVVEAIKAAATSGTRQVLMPDDAV